jgi:hypothetical protein
VWVYPTGISGPLGKIAERFKGSTVLSKLTYDPCGYSRPDQASKDPPVHPLVLSSFRSQGWKKRRCDCLAYRSYALPTFRASPL